MNTDDFYELVGSLINVKHEGKAFPHLKRTRWNNRVAGRGRYPGAGVVRVFSPTCIAVRLKSPRIFGDFTSFESVISALSRAY